ncbi:DUF7666 domain-containing protein [Achromobacter dolens]|uniref:DUF7666 domain-containing protein n=1 Tax=Achromobacter dolens TaxID=1287738 RepID=UPI000A5E1DEF|nr:hypothetical protein [Achromobacter dolens]
MADQPQEEVVTSYKAFNADLTCTGGDKPFQYEIGNTYEMKGPIKACDRGFHACEYPLNVFDYYPPAGSRFALVEQGGKISREGSDTKLASSRITIKAEIGIAGLIKAAIEYTFSRAKPEGETATGYRGAASATGNHGAASATGDQGAASATGDQGAASATGYRGAASATGYQGAASATGYQGAASATGDQGAASATGYQGAASATGDQGAASATGYQGAASATGYRGAASATGDQGAAMACGYAGKAMGALGNALFLVYRDDDYVIRKVGAAIVGENGIKPDTWYSLSAEGEFLEA